MPAVLAVDLGAAVAAVGPAGGVLAFDALGTATGTTGTTGTTFGRGALVGAVAAAAAATAGDHHAVAESVAALADVGAPAAAAARIRGTVSAAVRADR